MPSKSNGAMKIITSSLATAVVTLIMAMVMLGGGVTHAEMRAAMADNEKPILRELDSLGKDVRAIRESFEAMLQRSGEQGG